MPAPTASPLFATDPAYTPEGSAWDGQPTRVDPGAPIRAEGFTPGILPAEHLNHVLGTHGDWIAWLESERAAHATKIAIVEAFTRPDLAASRATYLHALQAAPGWHGVALAPAWAASVGGYMQSSAGGELLFSAAAGAPLPTLATVTGIRVFVKPGSARASGDRVRVRAYRQAASGLGLSQIGADSRDDGTTNLQTIDVGAFTPFALSSDRSDAYGFANLGLVIRVDSGIGGAADHCYYAEILHEVGIR